MACGLSRHAIYTMERKTGFEPASRPWQGRILVRTGRLPQIMGTTHVLQLHVMMELAGSAGFEPATRLATHTRLPSGRIRPLSQLPNSYAVIADDDLGARTFCCLCRKPSMHAQRSRHADSMRCRTGVSDSVMS